MEACAYCGGMATDREHVVAKSKFKTNKNLEVLLGFGPDDPENLVASCRTCNVRKLTLRRVPPSWSEKVDYLNALMGGRKWKVWNGDPKELYA